MDKSKMYKVVYHEGVLRLKSPKGEFIHWEQDLLISSSCNDNKDQCSVTVVLQADISELNSKK